jgi:hypothetical protein
VTSTSIARLRLEGDLQLQAVEQRPELGWGNLALTFLERS